MATCKMCGAAVPNGASFCTNCGAAVPAEPAVNNNVNPYSVNSNAANYGNNQVNGNMNMQGNYTRMNGNAPASNGYAAPQVGYQAPVINNINTVAEKPVSVGEWMGAMFVSFIPIIGFIMILVWAFGKSGNKSKSNYFKAVLIWSIIGTVIGIIVSVIMIAAGYSLSNLYY